MTISSLVDSVVLGVLKKAPVDSGTAKHRTGTPALSIVERLCTERGDEMPLHQGSQHSRSRLWD